VKYLLIILFLPIVSTAQDSDELLFGAVTDHFYGTGSSQFTNKLNPSGDWIANPMVGYRKVIFDTENSYYSWSLFGGENSIGDGMAGGIISTGVGDKYVRLGFLAGTYLQNNSQFYDKGLTSIGAPVSSTMELTPVVGVELIYNIDLTKNSYFIINNILTPAMYVGVVGLGIRM